VRDSDRVSGPHPFADAAVGAHVDALDPDGRALVDRFSALVLAEHPEATTVFARAGSGARSSCRIATWRRCPTSTCAS